MKETEALRRQRLWSRDGEQRVKEKQLVSEIHGGTLVRGPQIPGPRSTQTPILPEAQRMGSCWGYLVRLFL